MGSNGACRFLSRVLALPAKVFDGVELLFNFRVFGVFCGFQSRTGRAAKSPCRVGIRHEKVLGKRICWDVIECLWMKPFEDKLREERTPYTLVLSSGERVK